jgi:transcriptional regulator with XRE-family HTH domain
MSIDLNPHTLRQLRTRRGWSQDHLAALIGRTARTVQRLEQTGRCGLETRSALASVFEVNATVLEEPDSQEERIKRARADEYERAPEIPMSPASLFAYANAHARPRDFIHAFAERRRLRVCPIDSESAYLNEQLRGAHIKTVRQLDQLIERHGPGSLRVSDYLQPEEPVDVGFLISLVLDLAVLEERGLSGLIEYRESLRLSSGGKAWAKDIFQYHIEVSKYG